MTAGSVEGPECEGDCAVDIEPGALRQRVPKRIVAKTHAERRPDLGPEILLERLLCASGFETPCVGGKSQISFVAADDPTATPTTFLTGDGLAGPTSMVYDGTKYLYVANNGSGTIVRASVDGTSGLEAVATSPAPPHQITYANGVLYWTTDTALVRCALR